MYNNLEEKIPLEEINLYIKLKKAKQEILYNLYKEYDKIAYAKLPKLKKIYGDKKGKLEQIKYLNSQEFIYEREKYIQKHFSNKLEKEKRKIIDSSNKLRQILNKLKK